MAVKNRKQNQKGVIPTEIGSSGSFQDRSKNWFEESVRDLAFPYSIETYDRMARDTTIAAALVAVNVVANRVPIYIEAYDQTNQHRKKADFLRECLDDMVGDETLSTVIQKALTFNKYGFAVLEKVFRRRRYKNGSKYDDGKIGIKYLPIRRQHSISDWKWDSNYRELEGLYQGTQISTNYSYLFNDRQHLPLKVGKKDGDKFIPRENFLLFKVDVSTDEPYSVSPLYHCYEGWRELQKYKDLENVSAQKNMNGILLGRAPQEYLSSEADDEMQAVGEAFKAGLTNVGRNEQSCVVIPSTRSDDAHGSLEWDVTTLQSSASHVTSISPIVQRQQNEILQLMFADVLRSGDEIAKDDSKKKSLLNTLVEVRIKEILRILNTDLIPELFRRNGWDDTKIPTIRYGEIDEVDMAEFAKAMQQLKATKLIPVTPQIINRILEVMGFTYRVDEGISREELDELLGVEQEDDSRSGDGMSSKTGGLNGTGNKASEDDNSASNLDNK